MHDRIKLRFSKSLFVVVVFIGCTVENFYWIPILLIAGVCLLLWALSYLVLTRRENGLPSEFRAFVDRVSLQMRAGHSFRKACEQSCETGNPFVQNQLRWIALALADEKQAPECLRQMSPKLRPLVPEFLQISTQSHQLLRRVDLLRKKMKMEQDFRRRSGEAAIQIRIQCAITSVLYLGLLVFVLSTNSAEGLYVLILVSLLLFAVGVLWILSVGRSYKWKL